MLPVRVSNALPHLLPIALLLVALLLLPYAGNLGFAARLGLIQLPYYLLSLFCILGLVLGHSREASASLGLFAMYAVIQVELQVPVDSVRAGNAYFLLCLLAPPVFLGLILLPDARPAQFWGLVALILVPVMLVAGVRFMSESAEQALVLNEIWPLLNGPGSLMSFQGRNWFLLVILIGLVTVFWRRQVGQTGLICVLVFVFITLNWLAVPMISTLMYLAAALTLLSILMVRILASLQQDELTGLGDRKAVNRALAGLNTGDVLVMADIDRFKKLNDSHGHSTGDQVLKMVAQILRRTGAGCRAYRYGGEEFMLWFSARRAGQALEALEKTRLAVADYRFVVRDGDQRQRLSASSRKAKSRPDADDAVSTSISMGAVVLREHENPRDALKRADALLYKAKRGGRNRICQDLT